MRMIFDDIVVVAIKQSCKVSNNVISNKRKPIAFRHQGFIRAAERLKTPTENGVFVKKLRSGAVYHHDKKGLRS